MNVHRARAAALVLSVAFAGVYACEGSTESVGSVEGSADGGRDAGPLAGLVALDVTPTSSDLLAGDTNTSATFVARGRFGNGTTRDVSNLVLWQASGDGIVTMNGPRATATGQRGGEVTVTASSGELRATAQIRVKLVKNVLAPGVTAAEAGRFNGTTDDAALAPELAYPLSGALFPPNLPPIEVQWKPAAGTNLFDIAFAGPSFDVHFITKCTAIGTTGGCGLTLDAGAWATISSSLAGKEAATVVVRAAGATAGSAGSSRAASIQFSGDDLLGGLYYFNTRPTGPENKAGIFRYDFATKRVGSFFTAGECAGCHSLSKDGTRMLATVCTTERKCDGPMQVAVLDVATKQVVSPAMPAGDTLTNAWSPDNKYYVTTPQCGKYSSVSPFKCETYVPGTLQLVNAATNTRIGTVPAGAGAAYPSFSNDGKRLVYARGTRFNSAISFLSGSLFTVNFDGATSPPTWGAEKLLVPAAAADAENNFHPEFSPDDQWVAFSRSNCKAGDPASDDGNVNVCDTYNDHTARTWVVASGGGMPLELARANGPGRNTVSWPKWAPFKSTYKGGTVYWLTIASNRDYGFRALHTRDAQGNPNSGVAQLWLVGFDPAKAAAGQDPSFSPVWLPFQDVGSSNHNGQWTTKVVGRIN